MCEKEDGEAAQEIINESLEMGDSGTEPPPEGQLCAHCDRDAVAGPGDEWLCQKHQQEFFREWHG